MASITLTQDSASIGTTEYYLASDSTTATYQTADVILQVYLDFGNLTSAEEYDVTIYEKVNGTTAQPIYYSKVNGKQQMQWVSPAFILGVGWEVSVKKIAGTDRTIFWTLAKIG